MFYAADAAAILMPRTPDLQRYCAPLCLHCRDISAAIFAADAVVDFSRGLLDAARCCHHADIFAIYAAERAAAFHCLIFSPDAARRFRHYFFSFR